MKNIKLRNVEIISFSKNNNIEEVQAQLTISMYDYIINSEETVVRGNSKQLLEITYIISLTRNTDNISNVCPKCGADISDITSGKCPYCRTFIVNEKNNFRMSKKENIDQR